MIHRALLPLAVVAAVLLACAETPSPEAPVPAETPRPRTEHITAADLGDEWPLTVSEGTLECLPGSAVVIRTDSGTIGLSAGAQGEPYIDYTDRLDLLRKGVDGFPVPVGPLLGRGYRLCDG